MTGRVVEGRWYELLVSARSNAELRAVYSALEETRWALSIHHFWFEPWHPDGAVVRVLLRDASSPTLHKKILNGVARDVRAVTTHAPWKVDDDIRFYGIDGWKVAQRYFDAASHAAIQDTPLGHDLLTLKLIHCHLNTTGKSVWEELKWGVRFSLNRARMLVRGLR